MTHISAKPYSSADFLHSPIAIVHRSFPVLAIAKKGKLYDSMMDTLTHIKNELNGELMVILDGKEALDKAVTAVNLPEGIPEWLSPLVSIVPAQLFAYHLTCIKGHDPDNPWIIHKVTVTKEENSRPCCFSWNRKRQPLQTDVNVDSALRHYC